MFTGIGMLRHHFHEYVSYKVSRQLLTIMTTEIEAESFHLGFGLQLEWKIGKQGQIYFILTQNEKQCFFMSQKEKFYSLKEVLDCQIFYKNFTDHYIVVKNISITSHSQVLQVESVEKREQLVCKIIKPEDVLTIFQLKGDIPQEVLIIQELKGKQHKGIVEAKEIYLFEDNFLILCQFYEDGTLLEMLNQQHKLLKQEAVRIIMLQILQALDFLHDQGIMHRDLKMDNIMVEDLSSLHIRIIDFGFATRKRNNLVHCGTPGYIAPEMFSLQRNYNELCDIYSAGAIFHQLIAGKKMFNESMLLFSNKMNKIEVSNRFKQPGLEHAYDLFKQMIADVSIRSSCQECLEHIYFTNENEQHHFISTKLSTLPLSKPKFKTSFK